jgi:uncharacterized membrane protein HdeD (DUF308 family)
MCLGFTSRPKLVGWWLLPLGGFLCTVVGVLTVVFPYTTAQFLIFLVATWALLMGIIALVHAFSSAPSVTHRWLFILAGLLSFLLGVFLLVHPGGILGVVWLIGAFSIVYGGVLLINVMFPGKVAQTTQSDPDSAGG